MRFYLQMIATESLLIEIKKKSLVALSRGSYHVSISKSDSGEVQSLRVS